MKDNTEREKKSGENKNRGERKEKIKKKGKRKKEKNNKNNTWRWRGLEKLFLLFLNDIIIYVPRRQISNGVDSRGKIDNGLKIQGPN